MAIFLRGLALQNYRGIGPKIQRMSGFRDFNFFIGANNVGKSSVLRFISKCLPLASGPYRRKNSEVAQLDRHLGSTAGQVRFEFGVPVSDFCEAVRKKKPNVSHVDKYLSAITDAVSDKGCVWVGCNEPFEEGLGFDLNVEDDAVRHILEDGQWYQIWQALTGSGRGDIKLHWIPETFGALAGSQQIEIPKTELLPAIRQIGPTNVEFSDYSGRGLIDRLAQLQHPDIGKLDEQRDFERINEFVKNVTGYSNARIEIPHNREHVLVHIDGKVLPLSSLGSGIEEVILIAACCTICKSQIVCMEEPELHIHPLLQRKLTKYLRENTDNQYFIATHSPTFIDTPDAAIFHVTLEGGQTIIRSAALRHEKRRICDDLGHRASELLQSNAVIWVEGPSDRIYLQHWLSAEAPELVEGIHYSIMFYGGRLLSHLSAEDEEVTEFISLRALNRNIAILIDSDRTNASDDINSTKRRINAEFEKDGGVAWITAGREIENYIEHAQLQAAVAKVHLRTYKAPSSGGCYAHALYFEKLPPGETSAKASARKNIEREVDKVKVAREVCTGPVNLNVLDLAERIGEIVNLIRRANA